MIRILTIARVVWLEMIRRKDLYVLLVLLLSLLFLLLSLNIFGLGSVVRYVVDIGLLFTWLFSLILTVNATARQLPQEESKRTIYPLLAKPITRLEVIIGKWLGCWTIGIACTAVFYALVLLITRLRGGTVDAVCLAQGVLLHFMALGAIAAMTMAIAARLTYGAAASVAYVLIAATLVMTPKVPELAAFEQGISRTVMIFLYFIMPHFAMFDMRQRIVHDWGPARWDVIGLVSLYGLVWIVLLLLLAWLGYRKKRFKRGDAV